MAIQYTREELETIFKAFGYDVSGKTTEELIEALRIWQTNTPKYLEYQNGKIVMVLNKMMDEDTE